MIIVGIVILFLVVFEILKLHGFLCWGVVVWVWCVVWGLDASVDSIELSMLVGMLVMWVVCSLG